MEVGEARRPVGPGGGWPEREGQRAGAAAAIGCGGGSMSAAPGGEDGVGVFPWEAGERF